jgi:Na+-transporting methylmalonyl-CoA/oxaloacetate decarboxylase gamma subunit
MNSAGHSSMVVAVVFLALAILAVAVLVIKRIVRKKDVIDGGYVENDDDESPTPTGLR